MTNLCPLKERALLDLRRQFRGANSSAAAVEDTGPALKPLGLAS